MKFIKDKKHTMFCFTQNKIPGGLLTGAGAALAEAGRPRRPRQIYIVRQVQIYRLIFCNWDNMVKS